MTSKEFRLLLVLAAYGRSMTSLQMKRAGRYWFFPWGHMPDMVAKGWIEPEPRALPDTDGIPAPIYFRLTEGGRLALAGEMGRRLT